MVNKNWGAYPFPGTRPECWNFGPLQLWCKSTADELWVAHRYRDADSIPLATPDDCGAQEHAEPPEDIAWERWTLKPAYQEIQFKPIFPDLPLVIKPEYPFRVNPGVRTRIYVRVPLVVKVELGKMTIAEFPTVVLSKTWFGNFQNGELCYWISSAARKQIEPDPTRPFLAICPILIYNRSDEDLLVEKICHRAGNLALYLHKQQLWANETKVRFRGKNHISEIDYSKNPPAEAPKAKLITPPRNEVSKGLSARTFQTLKELPGFGFLIR